MVNNLHLIAGPPAWDRLGNGWLAPVADQPDYAGFFDSGVLSNLAAGGAASPAVGPVAVTPGVQGSNPPYLALNSSAYIQTAVAPLDAFTVIALCALDDTDTSSVLVSNFAESPDASFQIRTASAGSVHAYCNFGGSTIYADTSGNVANSKWAIRAVTLSIAGAATTAPIATMRNTNLTTNTTVSGGPSNGSKLVVQQPMLRIGSDVTITDKAITKIASIVMATRVYTDDEIAAIADIMRARAAAWGVTV